MFERQPWGWQKFSPYVPVINFKKKITFCEMGILWYELWNIKVKLNRLGILPSNPKQKFIGDKISGKKKKTYEKIIKTESWYFEDQPSHSRSFWKDGGVGENPDNKRTWYPFNKLFQSYCKLYYLRFFLIGRMPTMGQGIYTDVNIHTCVYV